MGAGQDRLLKKLDAKDWPIWADGYVSCPICGSTVHPLAKEAHQEWHKTSDPIFDSSPR